MTHMELILTSIAEDLKRIADAAEKIASTEYTKISIGNKSVTRSVLRDDLTKAHAVR